MVQRSLEESPGDRVADLERECRRWRRAAQGLAVLSVLALSALLLGGLAWLLTAAETPPEGPPHEPTVPTAAQADPGTEPFRPVPRGRAEEPIVGTPIRETRTNPDSVDPVELVLGVEVGGESRAYPLNMLTGPKVEVINDTLGGRPIVVTWCSLCHDAIVYDRVVEGKTLTFHVSGFLWHGNLVMADGETGSLWSQMLGEAEDGPWKGRRLAPMPSVLTDWKTWRAAHPEGTVIALHRPSVTFVRDYYRNPGDFVLGIASEGEATAWTFAALGRTPVIEAEWRGKPVVAVFDPASTTARLYARTLDDRVLSFHAAEGSIRDRETGSRWDPATGRALSGPLAGRSLTALPAGVSTRTAWREFHPRSTIDGAPGR